MENIMIRRLLPLFVVVAVIAPAVRANADTVYAVSNNDGRIIRYDSANPSGSVVTLSGSGSIVNAAGLALGPDGNLYIGESGNFSTIAPAIRRLDLSSNTLSTVYAFSEFDVFPGALAFKGNDLFVGRNPFYGNTGAVMRLSNATGGTTSVSTYTSGFSLASSPGLAFGADGALYVSSMNYSFVTQVASGSVVKFDATGAYLNESVAGGGSTGLLGPTGLGIQGTNLYTASIMNGSVLATNLLSGSTSSFGQTSVPFGASPLAMLSDGGLIVGSAGGAGAIYRFDAAGNLVDTFNSGLGTIGGVVAVPEPSTAVAAAIGIAAAAWMRRRRMAGS
jgi:hypothetical protein